MCFARDMAVGADIDTIVVLRHVEMDLTARLIIIHRVGKTRFDRRALRREHTFHIKRTVVVGTGTKGQCTKYKEGYSG